MLITLEKVTKRYGDKTVTDRFSYRFEPGKRYCLFGPSGCGKTTLLRLIAGLETPDEGKVTVEGGPFAIQFQEDRLLPWHRVLKNLTYTMDEETALEALKESGLENEADHRPGELSGGMRRRLSLMRALKSPSEAVLLDEPVRELDAENADRMLDVIDRETRGKLLILVTHDRSQAEKLGCTVIDLKDDRPESEEA